MSFAVSIAVFGMHLLQSRNPFIENEGVADPHLHVFNGTVYAYSTHDYSANNTHFRMDDWWVWKSDDLVDWHRVSVLKPKHTPADPSQYEKCYATDAAYRNGSYFWYLSTGPRSISVMRSPTPHGPWRDPLGKPLLAKGKGAFLQCTIICKKLSVNDF